MAKTKSAMDVRTYTDEQKWEDAIEWYTFKDGKSELVRLIGPIVVMARHWIETLRGKVFPMWCPKFDTLGESFTVDVPCPMHDDFDRNAAKVIIAQGLVRGLQNAGTNTIRGFMFPHGISKDLKNIMERLSCAVTDTEKGCDLNIIYDASGQGNNKWSVQRDDRCALTDEEKALTLYDFETAIPDYGDPAIGSVQARAMKQAMANHKWYVTPLPNAGDREGFARYKSDIKGAPYTDFGELVDVRGGDLTNKGSQGGSNSGGNSGAAKAPVDADIDDLDAEIPDRKPAVPTAEETEKAENLEVPPKFADHKDWVAKYDVAFGADNNPDCWSTFNGSKKCQQCPVKTACIDAIDDDD
jgi:hypothetical protein